MYSYPSAEEQHIVAKEIVTLFPQLKYDNIRPAGAPDEVIDCSMVKHISFQVDQNMVEK